MAKYIKNLPALVSEVQKTCQVTTEIIDQLNKSSEISIELEERVNSEIDLLAKYEQKMEIYNSLLRSFFYDCDIYPQITYDDIWDIEFSVEAQTEKLNIMYSELLTQFVNKQNQLRKERAQKRAKIAVSIAAEQATVQSSEQLEEIKRAATGGLVSLKTELLEQRTALEQGEQALEDLKKNVDSANDEAVNAKKKSDEAAKSIKNNKDVLFLSIALIFCIVEIVLLIIA